jgi:hypothetical protein
MMQFILKGFEQDAGIRLYAFEGIADRSRIGFTVGVDLALIPRYGIRVQELPLLCLELLERQAAGEEKHELILTEEEMRSHANACAAAREAAAQRKKPARRLPHNRTGTPWRGPQSM